MVRAKSVEREMKENQFTLIEQNLQLMSCLFRVRLFPLFFRSLFLSTSIDAVVFFSRRGGKKRRF